MSEWVSLKAIVERLAADALLDVSEAGQRLQEALAKGEIRTRAASVTARPVTAMEPDADLALDSFDVPADLWISAAVSWVSGDM